MASTWSSLKFELIGTGEQSGTWGTTTNANLGDAIEQAIGGKADITMSSTSETLTLTDTTNLQNARALYLNLSGTPGGAATLNVPAVEKSYIVKNGTNQIVTVKVTGQTGVAVPVGATMMLYDNGTDVVNAITNLPSGATVGGTAISTTTGTVTSVSGTGSVQGLTLTGTVTSSGSLTLGGSLSAVNLASQVTGTLPIANGGTGATSAGVALTNLGAYPSSNPNGYTSNTGTVTSVAASAGTGISISGSPITTSGTLTITNTGVTSAVAGTGVSVSAGTGAVTFSIGQAVATNSNVQFGSLGVGTAASGTTGEIRATNNVTAYYSDERLKTKLGNIENALDKICSLSGFYYEANEIAQELGYKVEREVGVSAQEVQRVLPEVVVPAPISDKYLTVRYEKLVPLLIEAIKELKAELEALKNGA